MNYDSITLNFWKEAVNREKRISLGWYLTHHADNAAASKKTSISKGAKRGSGSPSPVPAEDAASVAATADSNMSTWNNKTSYELSVILGRRKKAQEMHAQMMRQQAARLTTTDFEKMGALNDSRSPKHAMRKQNYGESCQSAKAVVNGLVEASNTYASDGTYYSTQTMKILPPTPFATRPASAKTQKLLYVGISAEGEGRAAYLKRRKEDGPQDKYMLPVLSNQSYGWEPYSPESPDKGRSKIVVDTFYRKNGVF
eukprot:Opistho-2@32789